MMRPAPVLLALLLLFLLAGATLAQGSYDLTWNTVDGGGGALSSGAYTLSGTVGQPDAGTMGAGAYALLGGFWGGPRTVLRQTYLPLVLKSQ